MAQSLRKNPKVKEKQVQSLEAMIAKMEAQQKRGQAQLAELMKRLAEKKSGK